MSRTVIHEGIPARIKSADVETKTVSSPTGQHGRGGRRVPVRVKMSISIPRASVPAQLICGLFLRRHVPLGIKPGSSYQPDMIEGEWQDAVFLSSGLRFTADNIFLSMTANGDGNPRWEEFAGAATGYGNSSARDKGSFVTIRFYGGPETPDAQEKDWPDLPAETRWFGALSGIDYVFSLPGSVEKAAMAELLPTDKKWVSAMARLCLCEGAVNLNAEAKGKFGLQKRELELRATGNIATAKQWLKWGDAG